MVNDKIYVCCPSYSNGETKTYRTFFAFGLDSGSPYQGKLILADESKSLLSATFNDFLVDALNRKKAGQGIGRFVMLHNDIVPMRNYISVLERDRASVNATMLSAVVPLKDPLGITSTAISSVDDDLAVERRITLAESFNLPQIFSIKDIPNYQDRLLCANTGCFILNLEDPIFDMFDEKGRLKVFFTINDEIRKTPYKLYSIKSKIGEFIDGPFPTLNEAQTVLATLHPDYYEITESESLVAFVEPEDWFISKRIQRLGGSVYCTRNVILDHFGKIPFSNQNDWGQCLTDTIMGKTEPIVPLNHLSEGEFDATGKRND